MVSFTLFCLYIKANLNNFLSDFGFHQQSALCCMTLCFSHLKRMSKTNRVLCKMCLFVCFFLFPHCISACTLSPLNSSLVRDTTKGVNISLCFAQLKVIGVFLDFNQLLFLLQKHPSPEVILLKYFDLY